MDLGLREPDLVAVELNDNWRYRKNWRGFFRLLMRNINVVELKQHHERQQMKRFKSRFVIGSIVL